MRAAARACAYSARSAAAPCESRLLRRWRGACEAATGKARAAREAADCRASTSPELKVESEPVRLDGVAVDGRRERRGGEWARAALAGLMAAPALELSPVELGPELERCGMPGPAVDDDGRPLPLREPDGDSEAAAEAVRGRGRAASAPLESGAERARDAWGGRSACCGCERWGWEPLLLLLLLGLALPERPAACAAFAPPGCGASLRDSATKQGQGRAG